MPATLHQTDPAPFLLLVNQYPSALMGDHPHRELQLIAAVAAQRAEHIAR
jgi:hypothetical protein